MKFEFSAGGIVYKRQKAKGKRQKYMVLVAQHSQHHGWVFPKGLIGDTKKETKSASARQLTGFGETKEEAALREVREETGVSGEILKELPPAIYWYNLEGEKIKKTVYYFLMKYVSGDIKDHDFEMENVEWLPMKEVENRLTYRSDKEVWKKTKREILNL